jgi:hypothetical protein
MSPRTMAATRSIASATRADETGNATIIGWGWADFSTVVDDYWHGIIAEKLRTNMEAKDAGDAAVVRIKRPHRGARCWGHLRPIPKGAV